MKEIQEVATQNLEQGNNISAESVEGNLADFSQQKKPEIPTTNSIETIKKTTGSDVIETMVGGKKFEVHPGKWYQKIISNTIGRLEGILTHTVLTLNPLKGLKSPKVEQTLDMLKRIDAKGEQWGDDVTIYHGHTNAWDQIKRYAKKHPSLLGKLSLLGVAPLLAWTAFMSNLSRADHYNVLAKTVSRYSAEKPVGDHEMGHAKFFDTLRKKPLSARLFKLLTPIYGVLYSEYEASKYAMTLAKDQKEKTESEKILIPAFGTYLGGSAASIVKTPSAGLFPLVGAAAGHIVARTRALYTRITGGFKKETLSKQGMQKKKKGFFGRLFGRKKKQDTPEKKDIQESKQLEKIGVEKEDSAASITHDINEKKLVDELKEAA